MRNADEDIERILNGELLTTGDPEIIVGDTVNFVMEQTGTDKPNEQIRFLNDKATILNFSGTTYKANQQENRPFLDETTPKPNPTVHGEHNNPKRRTEIDMIDLEEILGLSSDFGRNSTRETMDREHGLGMNNLPDTQRAFASSLFQNDKFNLRELSADPVFRLESQNNHQRKVDKGSRIVSPEHIRTTEMQESNKLLFRNPVMYQTGFGMNNYCKIKKRRRVNSNTWNSTGGLLAFHPSKLSSYEFVHGGMNHTPSPAQTIEPTASFWARPGSADQSPNGFRKMINNIDFNNVTVFELKNIMKNLGLNTSGKKQEMIARIKETLNGIKGIENTGTKTKDRPKDDPIYEKYFF